MGGVCGLANVSKMGDACCRVYELFKKNDLASAVSLQQELIYPNILVSCALALFRLIENILHSSHNKAFL